MFFALIQIVGVFALFLLTIPLQLFIALCVGITSGFPIFYRQKRVGRLNKVFTLYKFRTMVVDAEKRKKDMLNQNESHGPVFKIHNDPRFTRLGKFLSHTGLDELPQLWNVLKGEMALMGPRPLPVEEARRLKPWMQKRHRILPGIISPAILAGKYHEDFDGWMRSDVRYAKQKNTITDTILAYRSIFFLTRLFLLELGRRNRQAS